jgi:hypothetical protein
MLTASCVYVLMLETVLIWFLLWEGSRWGWAILLQLAVFHLFSWPIVGFFYPTLMFAILTIYPLSWRKKNRESLPRFLAEPTRAWPAYAVVGLFSLAQLLPRFMPGDTALTGEGRVFALHMFDAKPECEAYATVRRSDGSVRTVDLQIKHPMRIHCDPITYRSLAHSLCEKEKDAQSIDLTLRSRRSTEHTLHEIVQEADVCSKSLRYSLFSHNAWIRTH